MPAGSGGTDKRREIAFRNVVLSLEFCDGGLNAWLQELNTLSL